MNSKISQLAQWRVILAGNILFYVFSCPDGLPTGLAIFVFCCFTAVRMHTKKQNSG